MNLRGDSMKFGSFVVFIRHDSAEMWVFGYSITLGLGTTKKWPVPVFWVFIFVYSIALFRFFHDYNAWFCLNKGTFEAAAPKNEVQVRNFTERGNEQITPQGRWEKCMNSWKLTPRCKNCAWLHVSKRTGSKKWSLKSLLEFHNKTFQSRYSDFSVQRALSREIFVWEIWKWRAPLNTQARILKVFPSPV